MSPSTLYSRDLEANTASASSSPQSSSASSAASASSASCLCGLTSRPRVVLLAVLCAAAALLLLLPPFLRVLVSALSVLDASPTSAAVFFCVVVLLCSPFTLGYGVVVLTAGVVFGWWAFPLVYCASVLGGAVWFVLFRWLSASCGCNVSTVLFSLCPSYSLYLRAFTSALESYPVRSAALLQLSFLPFGALCALLSSTELRPASFVLACCISRLKLLAYVSLAQSAGTVHMLWTRDAASTPARWQDAIALCVSVVCSVVALSTISLLASRQLKRMREDGGGASTPYALPGDVGAEAEAEEQRRLAADDGSAEPRVSEYNRLLSPRGSRASEAVRLDVRDVVGDEGAARHFNDSEQLLALHVGSPGEQTVSPQLDALSSLSDSARVRKLSGSSARIVLPAAAAAAVAPSSPLSSSVSALPLRSSSPRRLRADSPSSARLLLLSSVSSSSSTAASSRRRPSDAANPANITSQSALTASYPFLVHHSASHSPLHANQHSYTHPHSPRRKVSASLQLNQWAVGGQ